MKLFRTNMALFITFPVLVMMLMLSYMLFIYPRSAVFMNATNICFDVAILVFYLTNFTYQIRVDEEWAIFYGAFKSHTIKREELGFVIPSPIMTKFVCRHRNYYMLTTKNGSLVLKSMLRDMIKDINEDGKGE